MQKTITIAIISLLLVLPFGASAQTVTPKTYSPQYIALLEKLLVVLEQELAAVEAEQGTVTSTPDTATTTWSTATSTAYVAPAHTVKQATTETAQVETSQADTVQAPAETQLSCSINPTEVLGDTDGVTHYFVNWTIPQGATGSFATQNDTGLIDASGNPLTTVEASTGTGYDNATATGTPSWTLTVSEAGYKSNTCYAN